MRMSVTVLRWRWRSSGGGCGECAFLGRGMFDNRLYCAIHHVFDRSFDRDFDSWLIRLKRFQNSELAGEQCGGHEVPFACGEAFFDEFMAAGEVYEEYGYVFA